MQGRRVLERLINACVNSSSCLVWTLGMLFLQRFGEYPSSFNTEGHYIALETIQTYKIRLKCICKIAQTHLQLALPY